MTWPAGLAVELATSENKFLASGDNNNPAVITNQTLVRHTGGALHLNYAGRVENFGEWRVEKDGDVFWRNLGNFGTFWNRNLFGKVAGAGTATIQNLAQFHNFGMVSNAGGVLEFFQAATWGAGSVVTGAGTNRFSGGVQTLSDTLTVSSPAEFSGTVNVANGTNQVHIQQYLLLSGGTLGSRWSFASGAGPFRWTGGTVAGAMTWPAGLAVELATSENKFLASGDNNNPAVITNQTLVRHTGGALYLNHAGRVESSGEWRVEKDGDVFWRNLGNFGAFQNRGDFVKTDTSGTVTIQNMSFTNWGRIVVPLGEIYFPGTPQDLGPGALRVGLGGPTILTERGRVRFGGQARLNGPLEIVLTNGFTPDPEQTWEVARFGSRTGTFTGLDAPLAPDGYSWNITYDATTARLFFAPAGLPAGLVAYYPAEGNALDVVGIHHGTNQNGAGFAAGKIGQTFSLDGINDIVHLGFWSPGSQWTVAAWANPSSTPSGRRTIVGGVQDCTDWAITMQNGVFGAVVRPASGCSLTILSGTNAVPGQWYHLVVTSDGATARLYVNGQLTASAAVSPNYVGTVSSTLIGGEICCPGANFPGLVDEIAIFDRPIGLDEIAALYNNGNGGPLLNCITPAAGLAVSLSGESNALNSAGLPHGVWHGTPAYATGLVHTAFNLTGGRYLELPDSPSLRPTNFTIEGWFYLNDTATRSLVAKAVGAADFNSYALAIAAGQLTAGIGNVAAQATLAGPAVEAGRWYHFACAFVGDANLLVLYLDGAPVATNAAVPSIGYDAHPLLVGGDLNAEVVGQFMNGRADEVALYHRALNQPEIALIFAAGASGRCRGGGPSVVALAPAAYLTNDFDRLQANFNVVVDPATFTAADVMLTGPSGPIPQGSITTALITNGNGRTFEIIFPAQTVEGTYTVSIGTNIQNAFGQFAASVFNTTRTFDKTGPRVTNATPAGTITTRPSFFDVFFDTDILIGSFTLADAILTGPGAPNITSIQRVNARQYRVHLAALLPPGTFELSIGPNVTDLAGNAMDQNANGVRGEIPGDVFNSSVTVELADLAVVSISVPGNGLMGGSVPVVFVLTNQGASTVPGPWQQRFHLANNAGGAGAVNIGNVNFAGPLVPGASITITQNVILPNGHFGVRHLGVTTDSANQIAEYLEDNNTLYTASPILIAAADLVATYIGSPGTAELGSTLNVGFTTENTGDAATGPFNDRLWLSGISNSTAGATLLATVAQNPFAAGVSLTRTQIVTLPLAGFTPGAYFLVSQVDALNEQAERSEANNRISTPLQLVLPPRPDLVVSNVLAPTDALPGQAVGIAWTVTNSGSLSVTGVWSETIFLTTNAAGAGALELGTFKFTNDLPVGGFLARTQSVVVPPASPLGEVWFAVQTDSRGDVTEESEANNLGAAATATLIPAVLTLQPAAAQISEGASQALLFNVTRNGSHAAPLTVTITNGDPSEIFVTNEVIIPAGQASASFNVLAVHDGVVDGAQLVTLTVGAQNFQSAAALVTVLDVDLPQLGLQLAATSVLEGQTLGGTVSRDGGTNEAVSVVVASSNPAQLLAPAPVTIPAGAFSADFTLLALDDSLIESPATYTVGVSAPGHLGTAAEVTVNDDDLPLVTVSIAPDSVSESAGSQAAVATITRSPVSPRILVIDLESSNTNAARVPARVTIPAGETNVTVPVAAVNNTLVDGPKLVQVRPWILASGSGLRVAQGTPAELTVTDDDGPTLQLSLDRQLVAEGFDPAAAGTVSRNSGTNEALLVMLTASDTNEVRVPPSVTIPAGALSASFNLASVADGVSDGNKGVTLLASAPGFVPGTAQIVVSDVNLADLVVSGISAPPTADTEAFVNIGYTLRNQGPSGMASNSITQRILLSHDPLPGDDLSLGEFTFNGPLPSGVEIGQTFLLRMPQAAGEYWVIVETDVLNAVTEVLEDNNRRIFAVPIQVSPAYDAIVSTTVESAPSGTPVPMTGHAFRPGGVPAPFSLVNIHIELRDTRRVISALTDANGDFAATWQPLPGEAGSYEIAAAHPGVADPESQDTFLLFGMRAYPDFLDLKIIEAGTVTGAVDIVNAGDLTLTALAVQLTNLPANLNVTMMLETDVVAGLATNRLSYSITAADASLPLSEFVARITSAEGAVLELPVFITVEQLRARLAVRPTRLVAGMKRGVQTFVSFDVVNTGGADTGPVQVSLPPVPWLALASVNPLPWLAPGETNRVTLQLTPPADLDLTTYNGTLALNATGTGLGLPFEFRALSEAKGDLLISAVDEFTFYAEGSPKLTNATVTVRDAVTGNLITNEVTDASGELFVPQLMEGYYDVIVTADRHSDHRGTHLVEPGVTNTVNAFLSRQTVRYTWSVERIEIEDRYQIVIETEFEANVPAPVVTLDPPSLDVSDLVTVGQFKQVNMTLQNHGLIAAEGNVLRFDSHPFYEIKPLIEDIGRLPAKSSLTIPVMIRRIGDFDTIGGQPDGVSAAAQSVPCTLGGTMRFYFECGGFKIDKSINVPVVGVDWICRAGRVVQDAVVGVARFLYSLLPTTTLGEPSRPAPGRSDPLRGSDGEIFFPDFNAVGFGIKLGCDPTCLVLAAGGCISKFPVIGCFFSGFACGKGLAETGGTDALAWVDCGVGAAGCLIPPVGAAACLYSLTRCFISPADGAVGAAGFGDPIEAFKPGVRAMMDSFNELTGAPDGVWLNPGTDATTGEWYARFQAAASILSEGGRPITAAERADLMSGGQPAGVPPSEITRFLDRWNRSLENYALGILRPADAPPGANADFIDAIALRDHLATAGDFQQLAEDSGFTDPINAIVETVRFRATAGEEGGVCARVKLSIDQRAVLSREAFRATLELANEEGAALENIAVKILITDALGNDANALFGIREPELTNLEDVSGSGSVATGTSGTARWTIVPTVDAAPTEPVEYFVYGEMHYTLGGVAVTIPLLPVPITVNPTARLALHYFHERDVFSDDPHTDEIEPSIPFNLAVMVNNFGYGDARNFRITSGQPEIIENEKGLLIDFKIIATEVAGQNLSPSLTANFGTIPAQGLGIARWLLTSTLQGLFINYSATFEHLDGQGNPRLSLIDSVEIHEMIRLVNADGPFDDGKPDFLVNDLPDLRDFPDTLWLSDGSTQRVSVVTNGVVTGTVTAGNLQVQLSVAMPGGWAYLRLPDPSAGGFRLVNVRRGDNSMVANAWTTDRTFHGQGKRPAEEDILHLLDYNSAGEYTLTYEPLPPVDNLPPASAVAALPESSRTLIPVNWSGQDNEGGRGIAFYDIYVSENSGPFQRWLTGAAGNAATYQGVFGKTYAFYSIAVDQAGNREAAPATPDAQTAVTLTNRPPELAAIADLTFNEGQTLVLDLVATDPDGDSLTFTLLPGTPAGMLLNPVSGRLTWITGEAHGPSTNVVTVRVLDTGTPLQTATRTFTITVLDVNAAPTLAPVPAQTVNEGSLLTVTNVATDTDLPAQQLTFSLGAGAPAGAAINPTNGVFTWRPSEIQGGTTNPISVIVTDNGEPPLSATQTFAVIVHDTRPDFALSIGTTQLLSGASARVPLTLNSGADLTNARLVLAVSGDRLTNLQLQSLAPEVGSADFLALGDNRFEARFHRAGAAFLQGNFPLGQLAFGTISNEHSAAVLLRAESLTGERASSASPLTGGASPGRVFIVGLEPILDAAPATNRQLALILYARTGERYQIEHRLGFDSLNAWLPDLEITPMDLKTLLPLRPVNHPEEYFRVRLAVGFELTIRVEGNQVVIEWSLECAGCELEEAGQLGPGTVWTRTALQPQEVNGLHRITLAISDSSRFYRLVVPQP
jgi:hypothetical protein